METNTNIFQNTAATSMIIKENIAIDLENPEHIFSFLNVTQDHINEKLISTVIRRSSGKPDVTIGMIMKTG